LPVVTVFNHDNWARNIKHLVEEVMEIEKRVHAYPVTKVPDYNFAIHQIEYEKKEIESEVPKEEPYELLTKGYITYSTQVESAEKGTVYERVITGARDEKATQITYKMYPIDVVVQEVSNRLRVFDVEEGTEYAKEFTIGKIKDLINNSLNKVKWNQATVSEENYKKTLQAFGVVKRRVAKTLRFELEATELAELNTTQLKKVPAGFGSFRRGATVFFDEDSLKLSDGDDVAALNELIEDETLPRMAIKEIRNKFSFKTPLNVVFAHSTPERKFIEKLISNAESIDAWIKSRDVGYYTIEYSWRKGEHPKQGKFNPDFFIKTNNKLIVAETKDDELINRIKQGDDLAKETRARYRYAIQHFDKLNDLQKEQSYYFTFLTPIDFDKFFEVIKSGSFSGFRSQLDVELD